MTAREDTTPLCTAHGCHRPSPHGALCRSCVDRLVADLRDVEALVDELLLAITRADRLERHGRPDPDAERRTLDRPELGTAVGVLPYREDPSEVGRDLHAVLTTWIRHLCETRGVPIPELVPVRVFGSRLRPVGTFRFPGRETVEAALWLARHPDTIAGDEAAAELESEVRDAIARTRRSRDVDELQYLGPCSCSPTLAVNWCARDADVCDCGGRHGQQVDLYAKRQADFVTCASCGARWDTADRREWLLERVEDQLDTAAGLSRALADLAANLLDGKKLTDSMIRGYAHRGAITPHPPHPLDAKRLPRYRVGEVMAHLRKVADERRERDVRRDAERVTRSG